MKKTKNRKKEQNEYAEDIQGKHIYILNAESGQKGYFCIGCKNQMQSVRSNIKGRKQFFRHVAIDVSKEERKCTFSNQNYRHNQAVFILNRIKKIKVPTLYKYAPKNSKGKDIKIRDSRYIEAKNTKSELTFYETDEGLVKFGKNTEIDSKNLLIRPDVTFFNNKDEPILLIEIVVTHKIDIEKLAKIRRLGIDTVQITIPKDSLENIENNFHRTNNIKWIYNNEQERTEYIFIPNENSKGVSQIDELQRKYFEESFECRKSEINNLIRTIKKHLGTQQYKAIESEFRNEISRVENNTIREKRELNNYREEIRNRVESIFKTRFIDIERQREHLESKSSDLERRYNKKNRELKFEQREIEKSLKESETHNESEEEIRRKISEDFEYREELSNRFRELKDQEQTKFDYNKREIQEEEKGLPNRFKELTRNEQKDNLREREIIQERRNKLPEFYSNKREELKAKFERIRREIDNGIQTGNYKTKSEFTERFKKLSIARTICDDWEEKQRALIRNRKAMECFKKGSYKKWYGNK